MPQHYTDPSRENDPHALPDVETFTMQYRDCPDCGTMMQDEDAAGRVHCLDCVTSALPNAAAWFYWYCFPGCLPDSDPIGPFATETLAIEDARKGNES